MELLGRAFLGTEGLAQSPPVAAHLHAATARRHIAPRAAAARRRVEEEPLTSRVTTAPELAPAQSEVEEGWNKCGNETVPAPPDRGDITRRLIRETRATEELSQWSAWAWRSLSKSIDRVSEDAQIRKLTSLQRSLPRDRQLLHTEEFDGRARGREMVMSLVVPLAAVPMGL